SIHDRGWVPGPPKDVYRIVESIRTYPSWWRGIKVDERETERHVTLTVPALGQVKASAAGQRPGVGLIIQLAGDVDGVLEWFLEPFEQGTVANVLLRLATRPRRWKRRERAYRSAVRDGLVAIRTMFEDQASARARRGAPAGDR
ncbi:MAG TPA: hypothetical protein VHI97_04820, partial [Actinomycetota bacterium]|nr:hypothetical protein [Actinomycetota bacterium]